MKTVKKKILVLALIVAMLALPMSAAFAENDKNDKFIPVSGEFYLLYGGVNDFNAPDNNLIWSQTDCTTMWTGGITAAVGSNDFTFIFVKPVFDGMNIVDYHRNLVQEVHTLTDPIIDGTPYTGELTIGGDNNYWRILGGTEDLANVHGQGTKWGIAPFTIGYEGWIHFGP